MIIHDDTDQPFDMDRFAGMFTVIDTGQWKFDGGTLTEWRIEMSGGRVVCNGFSIESTSAD